MSHLGMVEMGSLQLWGTFVVFQVFSVSEESRKASLELPFLKAVRNLQGST